MIVRLNSIFALLALIAAFALTHAHFPEYCAECEQEIWEQVPCSELSTTTILPPTTTANSTPRPISSTTPAPTTARPTVPSTLPWTTTRPPIFSTPPTPSTYKKCYCECKLGCKEFCRKVSVASPKQQITQISSTGDYAPGGQIEYTHSHQRKYYPKYAAASNSYKPYPVVYSEAAAAEAASAPAANNINAPNYTLEELAHLLSTAYGTKKGYPASPPPPPPQLQPQPSAYYSPQPLVARLQPEYRQVINKAAAQVPRERVIIRTAAAAVSSSGRAVAKAKTPYGEVVATSAPIYESTTSYPMPPPETPKSYPAPEPEPEPEPEPVPVPLPMPQTEAYPTQTEAYPDKSYETPESNSIKPESASSFDLAIDNYLKDFGYDNQVRDLGY